MQKNQTAKAGSDYGHTVYIREEVRGIYGGGDGENKKRDDTLCAPLTCNPRIQRSSPLNPVLATRACCSRPVFKE